MPRLLLPVIGGPHARIARPGELMPLGRSLDFRALGGFWEHIPDQAGSVLVAIDPVDLSDFAHARNPITFSIVNLPAGLSMDTGTGIVTGTPTTAENPVVTVTGTTIAGSADQTFMWRIGEPLFALRFLIEVDPTNPGLFGYRPDRDQGDLIDDGGWPEPISRMTLSRSAGLLVIQFVAAHPAIVGPMLFSDTLNPQGLSLVPDVGSRYEAGDEVFRANTWENHVPGQITVYLEDQSP